MDGPVSSRSNNFSREKPMKGNAPILKTLNSLLAAELTAINQHLVHSEMCSDWEYSRLHDSKSETGAIRDYNQAIAECVKQQDNGTRALLEGILQDEEEHIDWLEAQLEQIEQRGKQNYLAMQVDSE
jgi:bacterioferritin